MLEQVVDERHRLAVGDVVGHVDGQPLEVGGDPPLADALGDRRPLGLQLAMIVPVEERRAVGIGEADLHVGPPRPQPLRDPGERAARADRADEAVDPPAGLLPDLGRRALDVRPPVGDVVELVGPDRAVRLGRIELLREPARVAHVVVRVAVRHRRDLDQRRRRRRGSRPSSPGSGCRGSRSPCGTPSPRRPCARPMPVLPAVPSTMVPPGRSAPRATASRMIQSAARSLTEAPGFMNSALPQNLAAGGLGGAPQADQRGIAHGLGQVPSYDHCSSAPPHAPRRLSGFAVRHQARVRSRQRSAAHFRLASRRNI